VKRYRFIEAEKAEQRNVNKACTLLEVSRSAYYAWSANPTSARAVRDRTLGERIVAIHERSRKTYGAPRVHAELANEGVATAKKRVARLMAERGIAGRHKRRFKRTTIADPNSRTTAVDLLQRNFSPEAIELDRIYVGDITYVRTWEGWLYLATVLDLASRRVVGWAMADHMRTDLVTDALQMAIEQRRPQPGLIFHADRGSQYTSNAFTKLLEDNKFRQSLSRPGQCWDNAVAESFFSTLKTELIYREVMSSRNTARRAIFEFIEVFYNRQRLHSSLGYVSPAAFETGKTKSHNKAEAA
jgi:transposase InsO family protein